jgi:signal transduction histidine kinase/CheY-like chemotaxis protein
MYVIFPSFSSVPVKHTEDEAIRVAQHLARLVVSHDNTLMTSVDFSDEVEKVKEVFNLESLKVFSASGEVIHSNDPGDIGTINTRKYFHEIVAKGNNYTNVVRKDTKSLEGRELKSDVVETYVPIIADGKFIGAFEIYYDITGRNNMLNKLVFRSSLISFTLMFGFFVFLVIVLFKVDSSTPGWQTGELSTSYQSPFYLLFLIVISIFAAEAVVMLFLSVFPPISRMGEAIFDSSLLIMLISPVLYLFAFRPLIQNITERNRVEGELRKARDELEQKVKERTSELMKANDQLLHAQKMEAIGTLTGGIAHEFNNVLQSILGNCDYLQDEIDTDSPLNECIYDMQVSVERAANLTRGLLAYSRKQITYKKYISLNEVIEKVDRLLSRLISENINMQISLPDEDIMLMADSDQIQQVLINLTTNAKDAIHDGGTLTISVEPIEIDNEFINIHGYGKPGIYALISVSDSGHGMDIETQEKIFEPFFTSKDIGKGTGLGLSIVYGIVKKHNGYVEVMSEPGKGSTFKIYLPVSKGEIKKAEPISVTAPSSDGKETVLLAEDDANVRKSINKMLMSSGYNIIEAIDGEDAIERFSHNKENIHLMLFDVVMPRKNGKEAYDEIKKIRSDVKVLFFSGYGDDINLEKEILDEGLTFISKPFSSRNLLGKIRQLLDT